MICNIYSLLIMLILKLSDDTDVDKLNPGSIMIASSIAKVLASVMTYPHEVCFAKLSSPILLQ